MPHAELKYSSDLYLDGGDVLSAIEEVILAHDSGSGACKGRAYPAEVFRHTHCLLNVSLLTKPHRDKAFTQALIQSLRQELAKHLDKECFVSIAIDYSSDDAYFTGQHIPQP